MKNTNHNSAKDTDTNRITINRRKFVEWCSVLGLGSTLFPGTLAHAAQDAQSITTEMVRSAARIAGIKFPQEYYDRFARMLSSENGMMSNYKAMQELDIKNSEMPAINFKPVPAWMNIPRGEGSFQRSSVSVSMPDSDEEIAFLPVTHLSRLIESRQITSTDLTKLYLSRLKKYDPALFCVVSLTEDLALQQAKKADAEIATGVYKGPLHGIPYGIKDLFSVKGYRTTWGASPYKDRFFDVNASVFEILSEAGAVLVAKLSTGALASGADWFRGTTRNPWNPKLNAYGSSAGPASATSGGLVGFAVGTETAGSITSPASACGLSGMRPTYGRISRYGCMALSWTLDKVGPLCRSAEDCAIVFNTISGPDGKDNTVYDVPFNWDGSIDLARLRIGYWPNIVEQEDPVEEDHEVTGRRLELSRHYEGEAVKIFRSLGAEVVPFEMPEMQADLFGILFNVESAAALDELTRSGNLDIMSDPPESSGYPSSLRFGRLIPAVEYLQANRIRSRVIEEFNTALKDFDLIIGSSVYLTNITGHPEISVPHGFYDEGMPGTLRLTGTLFGDDVMLKVAHAFQSKTGHHRRHPSMA